MSGVCGTCMSRYDSEVCPSCAARPEVVGAGSAPVAPAPYPPPHAPAYPTAEQAPWGATPYPRQAPYPPIEAAAPGGPVPQQRQAPPAYGSSKFVGDAQPIPGMPLSRIVNALCYVIAGIALLVISAQPGIPVAAPLIIGLAFIAYGIKIAATRSSYWVSSIVYVLAIGAVLAMFGVLSR